MIFFVPSFQKMETIRRWLSNKTGIDFIMNLGTQDMIYAYRKGMPLVMAEMAMRQNSADIGKFVRLINESENTFTWGSWLPLSISSYIVNTVPGSTVRLYNAWGVLQGTGTGEYTSYLIDMGGKSTYEHALHSNTAIARVLVDVLNEEDGDYISINDTVPLANQYVTSAIDTRYKRAISSMDSTDPRDLTGRDYFALLDTLVSANPTNDTRLKHGLVFSESVSSLVLEKTRRQALGISLKDETPHTKFGGQ